jgi:arylsulfatase
VAVNGRSYTIAAGVTIDSSDSEGVLYAHGGVGGGHSLYVKDRRLRYTFNWLGTHIQHVVADRDIEPRSHVLTAEFVLSGPNADPTTPGSSGKLTLYVDRGEVGSELIVTQPGYFCPVGDGICVGRDSGSPVSPKYEAPFHFTGGTIDKVVIDLSGEPYIDHEAQVRAWFSIGLTGSGDHPRSS